MILVGKIKETLDSKQILFRCCNKEEFTLVKPPMLGAIPVDEIIWLWVNRPYYGHALENRLVIYHWSHDPDEVETAEPKQKVIKWVQDQDDEG